MGEADSIQHVQKMDTVTLITKIFSGPKAAFENLKVYPVWVIPIILTLIFGYGFLIMTQDIQLEMQRTYILESESIPESSKDAALESIENPTFFMKNIMPAIGMTVSTFAIPAIIAALFLLFGNFVFGGSAAFKTTFAVSAWGGLIGLLEGIIKLPLILSKGTMEVYSSMALLMDYSQSKTVLFQLLNLIDIFSIWKIIVYATAFAVVYNFSKQKSYATIITLYVVGSLIGIGISQMFI